MTSSGPIRPHSTAVSNSSWDATKNESKLGDTDARTMRRAYAWVDPDGKPENKGSYKFIHHEVGGTGEVGAANVRACISGIAVLNGGRGGADIPATDRRGIYNHLARHLRDADHDPAKLE
jgi:hypothetical protein